MIAICSQKAMQCAISALPFPPSVILFFKVLSYRAVLLLRGVFAVSTLAVLKSKQSTTNYGILKT